MTVMSHTIATYTRTIVTYTYERAELTKLIANDLNVSVEVVDVRFNLHDVTVTVDIKKAEELKSVQVKKPFSLLQLLKARYEQHR